MLINFGIRFANNHDDEIMGAHETMNDSTSNPEFFTATTQLYVRLRRVTGRVIDVAYIKENEDYARHIVDLALSVDDQDVNRYAKMLSDVLELELGYFQTDNDDQVVGLAVNEEETLVEEPVCTAEEIYKAEVQHHYIGALR